MNIENLLLSAAKKKYRFSSSKGGLTVEDLFDLNLTSLDNIAVAIDEQLQKSGRKSFVSRTTAANTDLSNQLEIVKFVIETKQAEDEARKSRVEKEGQKAFLKGLLEKKKMEQLEGLSAEDIQKQLAALEG